MRAYFPFVPLAGARHQALLRWSPHLQGRRYLDILERGAVGRTRPVAWDDPEAWAGYPWGPEQPYVSDEPGSREIYEETRRTLADMLFNPVPSALALRTGGHR